MLIVCGYCQRFPGYDEKWGVRWGVLNICFGIYCTDYNNEKLSVYYWKDDEIFTSNSLEKQMLKYLEKCIGQQYFDRVCLKIKWKMPMKNDKIEPCEMQSVGECLCNFYNSVRRYRGRNVRIYLSDSLSYLIKSWGSDRHTGYSHARFWNDYKSVISSFSDAYRTDISTSFLCKDALNHNVFICSVCKMEATLKGTLNEDQICDYKSKIESVRRKESSALYFDNNRDRMRRASSLHPRLTSGYYNSRHSQTPSHKHETRSPYTRSSYTPFQQTDSHRGRSGTCQPSSISSHQRYYNRNNHSVENKKNVSTPTMNSVIYSVTPVTATAETIPTVTSSTGSKEESIVVSGDIKRQTTKRSSSSSSACGSSSNSRASNSSDSSNSEPEDEQKQSVVTNTTKKSQQVKATSKSTKTVVTTNTKEKATKKTPAKKTPKKSLVDVEENLEQVFFAK